MAQLTPESHSPPAAGSVHPSGIDRYAALSGVVQMTGLHALVRLPFDVRRSDAAAGHNSAVFISGYEGSPLAGYDLELTRQQALLDEHNIVFRPAINEELAATAIQGTQLAATMHDRRFDGVTGFWYGKSPGLDRSCDALRHANLGGTHRSGGAVLLVGDDPTAKSSTVPSASEGLLADLGIPTLYPANPQEILELGLHAVTMSRVSGLWAAMKIVTNVSDGSGAVSLESPDSFRPQIPTLDIEGKPFAHGVTTNLLGRQLLVLEKSRNGPRMELARRYAAMNNLNRIEGSHPDDRIGIVVAGKTYADLRQSLEALGLDEEELRRRGVRVLHLRMIYPLESTILSDFCAGLHEVIVIEDKQPLLEDGIKSALFGRQNIPLISGKQAPDGSPLLPMEGELTPEIIAPVLATRLLTHGNFPTVENWIARQQHKRQRIDLPLAQRAPYFCSGCPHNTSTHVPAGSLVSAGIGCHGLAVTMSPSLVGEVPGFAQMGGEGAHWIGMQPFIDRNHLFQNLGDGTYHHSGSLAVRSAVAAKINITYKLLYNSTVAMTGGQDIVGQLSVPQLTHELVAEGVAKIIVTTATPRTYKKRKLAKGTQLWHRDRIVEAQEILAGTPGVTVLIHDQECATELRRKRKRGLVPDPADRVVINERLCEGCGDCGSASNCLSVQPVATEFGRKTKIDQSSCNKDYSCLKGDCPSFMTVVPSRTKNGNRQPDLPASSLPTPSAVSDLSGVHTTRILGIGGSGVVTISQILSVAASTAGLSVVSLDQTGLAQKGGAVVSDIKISRHPFDRANKATDEEVDLYIGADLLVAADPIQLRSTDSDRTIAVISLSQVPTGHMVADSAIDYPSVDLLTARITDATLKESHVFLDARQISEDLFGEDQYANLLLAGVAYQLGALPLPWGSIERAIRGHWRQSGGECPSVSARTSIRG